jgi:cytochrome c oxidase subunit 2
MNKYLILAIAGVAIIVAGVGYRAFFAAESSAPVVTGQTKEFTITAVKDKWLFDPETIEVDRGDKLILRFVNADDYDHGVAIDAYGVSQRMPANETITVELVATQAGEFPFYCSVPCGEGHVEGEKRTHFDMVGKIKVKDIIQPQ